MGYIGEIFTKPLALALLLWIVWPDAWSLVLVALCFRAGVAWATAVQILKDPLVERHWWLLPLEDVSGFLTWVLGFFGKSITWRGRKLVVARDGSFEL